MSTTSKLYQYEVCPFCWKVRTALALKKVPYETVEVHPLNKKELQFSEYKKVPVWTDKEGKQVNDSNEIMSYIDKNYEGPKLFEEDITRAAREKALIEWSEKYVKAIPPAIYSNFGDSLKAFDYITKTSKFSWHQKALIKFSGAAVMKMVAKKSKERQGIDDVNAHLVNLTKEWETALEGQKFAGGDKPNAADAAVYGITMSISTLPASKLMSAYPGFHKWIEDMGQETGIAFEMAN